MLGVGVPFQFLNEWTDFHEIMIWTLCHWRISQPRNS